MLKTKPELDLKMNPADLRFKIYCATLDLEPELILDRYNEMDIGDSEAIALTVISIRYFTNIL